MSAAMITWDDIANRAAPPTGDPNKVEVMNGTAVWTFDAKKNTSRLAQKPGFPEPVSMNPAVTNLGLDTHGHKIAAATAGATTQKGK